MKSECPNKQAEGWFNKRGARPGGGDGVPVKSRNHENNNNGKRRRSFEKLNCTSLEEADTSKTAVLGTLSLLNHYGKDLFDTGATTSFLSSHFIEK